jgi:uncharacterized protein (TIGR02186 family)
VFIDERSMQLRVVKTGIEQSLTSAAYDTPYLYGFFAVALALITGWGASLMFRKE